MLGLCNSIYGQLGNRVECNATASLATSSAKSAIVFSTGVLINFGSNTDA